MEWHWRSAARILGASPEMKMALRTRSVLRAGAMPGLGTNQNQLSPRQSRRAFLRSTLVAALCGESLVTAAGAAAANPGDRRLLYVAVPGIRDYLERGGHGVLVFDIDRAHAFVKRIPAAGLGADKKPLNVKGVAASAATGRLYVSTLQFLTCFDLLT